ncbi:hypothetical protein AAFF_G00147870 [Aldrovandia affinis]|uniref:Uncharacterized protein n=1 Tax=Aldrovandia affinis TaxID=143900 RepID=A0AAD7RS54_9TELE|nr:hypothetical protein AAFF_G00147870 [Aldrovandia affinis]
MASLQTELQQAAQYSKALEDGCTALGFPIAAIKRGESRDGDSSEDEVLAQAQMDSVPRADGGGPFECWWEALMNQRHAFRLELRDIWQIILVAIPKELLRIASDALKTGRIIERGGRDTEDDALERLKAELIELRGPVPMAWSKTLDRKQGTK